MERLKRRAILPALRACMTGGAEAWQPMPTSAMLLGAPRDRLGVGQRVGGVGVARSGGGQHVLPGAGHLGDGLPGRPVALEPRDERGVDDVVLEGPDEEGGDEAAVLSRAEDVSVGGPRQHGPPRDARDLLLGARPTEQVVLDVGLPGPKARAGPGAQRAALHAVGAVVGSALCVDVEGPVDALGVVVAEHVVGARRSRRPSSRCRAPT